MTLKRTTCKHCRGKLEPGQRIHPECVEAYAEAQGAKSQRKVEKAARIAVKAEKEKDKAKLDQVVSLETLHKQAQPIFNRWIRARDAEKPCISCNAPPPDHSQLHAGRDAGHWRSVGSARHLRYNEDNVHGQCVHCNQYLAGNNVAYRAGLVKRIGLDRVEALENDNAVKKWKREEIIAIRDAYKQKLKELRKAM